jgi:hypothetical protein
MPLSVLADNQIALADEEDAHATRDAHRHRRSAVCAGAQRAATAAALSSAGGAGSTARQQHQLRPGKEHSHSRAQQTKRTRAFRYAQPMFFPEAQPTSDPSGTQQKDCSLWVMVPGGTLSQQCFQPIDESMYGALTRVVQPPRCWQREAGASYARRLRLIAGQRHRDEHISEQARMHCLSVLLTV